VDIRVQALDARISCSKGIKSAYLIGPVDPKYLDSDGDTESIRRGGDHIGVDALRPELPCCERKRESPPERDRFCFPGGSARVHESGCHLTRPFICFSGAKADASVSRPTFASLMRTLVHR
jgi:hypothetical protein